MANENRENQKLGDESGFEGARAGERSPGIEDEERVAAGAGIEGEGSYLAAREYDRRLGEFVRSGRVEQAANDAEQLLERDPDGHARAEQQGKARPEAMSRQTGEPGAGQDGAVHVKHERQGWVVVPGSGKIPMPVFDSMDDALRRAHEIAAEQHLPLFVHGPDGELIDKYDAL